MPRRGEVLFSMIYIDDLLDGARPLRHQDVALNNDCRVTGNDPQSLD